MLLLLLPRTNLNVTEIFEVCSTFYQNRLINFLLQNQMVMSSKNEIDLWELFCHFDIVVFHHVGQSYD